MKTFSPMQKHAPTALTQPMPTQHPQSTDCLGVILPILPAWHQALCLILKVLASFTIPLPNIGKCRCVHGLLCVLDLRQRREVVCPAAYYVFDLNVSDVHALKATQLYKVAVQSF